MIYFVQLVTAKCRLTPLKTIDFLLVAVSIFSASRHHKSYEKVLSRVLFYERTTCDDDRDADRKNWTHYGIKAPEALMGRDPRCVPVYRVFLIGFPSLLHKSPSKCRWFRDGRLFSSNFYCKSPSAEFMKK